MATSYQLDYITKKDGTIYFPYTKFDGVLGAGRKSLTSYIDEINEDINQLYTYVEDYVEDSYSYITYVKNELEDDVVNKYIQSYAYTYNAYQNAISYVTDELYKKVDKIEGKGLSTEDFTTAYMTKLDGIEEGAEVNVQANWNTTDPNDAAYIKHKPEIPSISGLATVSYVNFEDSALKVELKSYVATELSSKVNKEEGKGLSTNDFTVAYMQKLNRINEGSVNQRADWNVSDKTSYSYILNKPEIPSIEGLATVSYVTTEVDKKVDKEEGKGLSTNDFTTSYMQKLDRINEGSVNQRADWNASDPTSYSYILNKPVIPSIDGLATISYVNSEDTKVIDSLKSYVNSEDAALKSYVTSELSKKVNAEEGKGLSTNDFTVAYMQKLDRINEGSVNQRADWNVADPTSYSYILNKPEIPSIDGLATVSYVTTEVAKKVDKEDGKGLSTNDFTTSYMQKLDKVSQANWNVSDSSDSAYIKNKPEIPSISGLATISYVTAEDASLKIELQSYTASELLKKVDKIDGKGLSTNDFTTSYMQKLDKISQANWNVSDASDPAYILHKPEIAQADWNVSDDYKAAYIKNKPEIPSISGLATVSYVNSEDIKFEEAIKSYVNSELNKKVTKESGKGLSTNDFTTTYLNKLLGIAENAEVNVQADWNVSDTNSDAYILNKPTIPSISGLATVSYVNSEDIRFEEAIKSYVNSEDLSLKSYVTTELDKKVTKETNKGLSTNDFTTAYMQKLDGINMTYVISYIPYYSKVDVTSNLTNVVCPQVIDNYQQCHVVYKNSTATDYTVAVSTSYTTPDGSAIEMTIKAGGYGEINYFKIGNEVFVRAV